MAQHRIDSKPYILDRLFEISEVLYDAQGLFDRPNSEDIMPRVIEHVDRACGMLEKVLENTWWTGRPTHDRSLDPLNDVHTCIKDDGGTPGRKCYACEKEKDVQD